MEEKYMKLKIEFVINKILYQKGIIPKDMYEKTAQKIDKFLLEEWSKGGIFWHYMKWNKLF